MPGIHLKKLEAMIPKLNESSSKLTKNLSQLKPKKTEVKNGKRVFKELENHDDNEIVEIQPALLGYKKVKQHDMELESSAASYNPSSAFIIEFLFHPELKNFFTANHTFRYAEWSGEEQTSVIVFKREDFLFLPPTVSLRLSKEHAKITAVRNGANIEYEITDLSVNGTYFLGNKKTGTLKPIPARLQKGVPFKIRPGDCICLLLKKDATGPEILLGFEFQLHDK